MGSVSFSVLANDGLADSAPATITVCVISPNSSVARPSCAPTLPTPAPIINVGPGGGGGGGGSSSPAASFIAATYNNMMAN